MPNFLPRQEICDVCHLLDNDESLKECTFCQRCESWICNADLNRWDRRARAMVKKWGNQFGPTSNPSVPSTIPQPITGSVKTGCTTCGKNK